MKRDSGRILAAMAAVLLMGGVAAAGDGPAAGTAEEVIRVDIAVGPYQTLDGLRGEELSLDGFGQLLVPGKPKLPARIFAVAIPPGAEFVELRCQPGRGLDLGGGHQILPAPLPRVIGDANPAVEAIRQAEYDANLATVYGSDDTYPAAVAEFVRTAGYRKYNLVDVRVTPFAYQPLSGELTYYPEITVEVVYRSGERSEAVVDDSLVRTEAAAREFIINYEQATEWYGHQATPGRGLHDYVIVTLDSLVSAVDPLATWEQQKGRNVEVVTTSWINTNYSGYDLGERVRNFLRDKYPSGQWGIEDVLLVGDYDDLPIRLIHQDMGYGKPRTDFYYAELSKTDGQSWDSDKDHKWGEDADNVEFYNEINVGRIPWSDVDIVQHICEKSVAYEQNEDPAYKKNILLLGAYFWADTDNAELMEAKTDQPWMADWTMTRMYEQNSSYWSSFPCDYPLKHSNVMAVWPDEKFGFVNWAGHGSPTSCHVLGLSGAAFIEADDSYSLNDDYPAIIFADACSNSDTTEVNIGKAMLRQGAVGFVGATKVAFGMPGWDSPYDGSSQSLDYLFTTSVTSHERTQGEALQWGLRQMYTQGMWYYDTYEMCQWGALWGNPDLSMAPPPLLAINLPDGLPEYIDPGQPTTITVEIKEIADVYLAGSGLLHYRFDGGSFLTSPLAPLGGELYEATLPAAGCSDEPEFYFSIEGAVAGVVTDPPGAPAVFYSATVGEPVVVFADDFETDQGWTTEVLSATSGWWQRGVAVNDPDWSYDPYACSDGGACFLTQNEYGNTDVDDGAVRLTSPLIDMSAGSIKIGYDYFLRLTDTYGGVDRLLVEISSYGDAGPWIEIAKHDTDGGLDWRHHDITQADLDAAGVTLTATMKLRFTTNDADDQSINESGLDVLEIVGVSCSGAGPGDCDQDGDIDLDDYAVFADCLTGPLGGILAGCDLADMDVDTDVDLDDFAAFQEAFTN